jgi:glucose-6-phosphate 1-epimerase
VYSPALPAAVAPSSEATASAAFPPIIVVEGAEPVLALSRDNLEDVVVWNPWDQKAAGMGDFEPKSGWRNMVCVEAGSVRAWQRLEAGDSWTGSQTISLK